MLLRLFLTAIAAVTCQADQLEYDFVIVGGGTAGLALASRLSRGLPESSILVLEAGPDAANEPRINIPAMRGSAIASMYDWNFTTVPQQHAGNRSLAQGRGKVLGGSSALNFMAWDRASKVEYDTWTKLGNDGWDWSSMMRSMLKAENFTLSDKYGDQGVGFGGPIQTMIGDWVPEHQEFFMEALKNLNVSENRDSLGGNMLGHGFQPSNVRYSDRKRSYSAHHPGYPSLAGPNLQIRVETRVRKIDLVNRGGGDLVATGVTLEDNTTVWATKEVILAAGTMQSPGLLELSGIGQKDVLRAANIQQLVDLPGVGENLQDHLRIENSYRLHPNYTSLDTLKTNATFAKQQLEAYNAGKKSMYDYTGGSYAFLNWTGVADEPTRMESLAIKASDIPLSSSPIEHIRAHIQLHQIRHEEENVPQVEVISADGYVGTRGYPQQTSPLYGSNFFTLIAVMLHPFSTGSIHVTSSSISIAPQIQPNYFSHEYDIQALASAAKYLRKLASTAPLRHAWTEEYEPGLSVVGDGPDSDKQWMEYVINSASTIWHPVGTCAMLPQELHGVVNGNLTVYGTDNVRVIDASVIPVLLSGHPQTAVYGIAEKAAEMIISRWQ
ncbi:glucose-methanol-choline (gmc) oxidoreductase [Aspergillus bombycis]|uniref:Glucose-methanol-choline (Gmc) oxidoreductase n=1 Tax=Aspergillus bombycis TaxID=109264 RepID=A0A1F8AHJ5_9EURO|nr:glucose-methanol-choline (gmc) oxidoreductase [Aspergillus bombycis]OGM51132.1 glucose-methanol-choline (gmc) oxidoreductase [Aspergillus bombycis]